MMQRLVSLESVNGKAFALSVAKSADCCGFDDCAVNCAVEASRSLRSKGEKSQYVSQISFISVRGKRCDFAVGAAETCIAGVDGCLTTTGVAAIIACSEETRTRSKL